MANVRCSIGVQYQMTVYAQCKMSDDTIVCSVIKRPCRLVRIILATYVQMIRTGHCLKVMRRRAFAQTETEQSSNLLHNIIQLTLYQIPINSSSYSDKIIRLSMASMWPQYIGTDNLLPDADRSAY